MVQPTRAVPFHVMPHHVVKYWQSQSTETSRWGRRSALPVPVMSRHITSSNIGNSALPVPVCVAPSIVCDWQDKTHRGRTAVEVRESTLNGCWFWLCKNIDVAFSPTHTHTSRNICVPTARTMFGPVRLRLNLYSARVFAFQSLSNPCENGIPRCPPPP